MIFTYYLPNEQNSKTEYITEAKSIIIIGANGSGKSKLGAWIEQQDPLNIHRIGAQRSLNFKENISLKSYSEAEDIILYGMTNADKYARETKVYRWNHGKDYTTKLIDDFEDVLAALIALTANINAEYVKDCKKAEKEGKEKPPTRPTAIDKLINVWNDVFPQRKLQVKDSKFLTYFEYNEANFEYSSNQMSDGERAVLYLAAQVLCVPENKTLIIDEPELHLHRSIMNRLWLSLEKHRPDCLFIYITHDTQFASLHANADKIWIKEFNGTNWIFEKINSNNLPEDLLFDILGSRKNVLFVEGEKNSPDTQLYTVLYPNYYVIACGGCTQVIARTKAFKNNPSLHHFQVYGIIDRDYRSEHEINTYKNNNIYIINVAEVENLFLVEELIRFIASYLGKDPSTVFQKVKTYIIQQRFSNQIQKQICQSVVEHLKYQLASTELSQNNENEAKESLEAVFKNIDYEQTKAEQEEKFRDALNSNDYKNVLKVFNEKSLITSIGHFLGIQNNDYCNMVLSLLNGVQHDNIVAAISPYLPSEIPR